MSCPECGHDMYWQGGIKPSVCMFKLGDPMGHYKAMRGREWARLEERAAIVAWLRRQNSYGDDFADAIEQGEHTKRRAGDG